MTGTETPPTSARVTDDPRPWSRLHPFTPVIRGWKALAVVLVIIGQRGVDDLFGGGDNGLRPPSALELLGIAGALLALAVLGSLYAYLAWRMSRYRVTERALELNTGVLFRSERQARLDRLQAVDVVQPLLARITGLAELRLEVAGGSGSDVRLSYLREEQAQRLRNQLLAAAAGVRIEEGTDAPEAPERPVLEVPIGRLVASLVRSGPVVAIGVLVASLPLLVLLDVGIQAVFFLLPATLGVVTTLWRRFSTGFAFVLAASPDGLRVRHGLLEQRRQTVPPGRVAALKLSQPLLWRDRDWWKVQVNIAGYAGGGEAELTSATTLLPVGTRGDALHVVHLLVPGLADDDLRQVADGLTRRGAVPAWLSAPRAARWLDPVVWRRTGAHLGQSALLCRGGVLHRRMDVVPHGRTQSLGLRQGRLQRRLGLASVVVHSVPGPVSPRVEHLGALDALALVEQEARLARDARALAGPERWMTGPH